MKKLVWLASTATIAGSVLFLLAAQDLSIVIKSPERQKMAITDFRGSGDAQNYMAVFNQTLWADVESAGLFSMVSKSFYPARIPQQPADFQQPPAVSTSRPKRGQPPAPTTGNGLWMSDWSGPPVQTTYLTFGYGAVQNGVFVVRGFVFDMRRGAPSEAQVIGKNYLGSVDEAGARKAAHEFSCDIITQFSGTCIAGSHIYYTHQASKMATKEIWGMDADGSNQHAITHFNSATPGSSFASVSPDGSKIAFTSFAKGQPAIFVFSVDSGRDLRFYNQRASVNETPSFTPDGKQIVYASSAPDDNCCRIFIANVDGTGFRPITAPGTIDVEPKVNPKTGNEIAFVSGRSGHAQLYTMNIDGGNVERISDGSGEATNPAWNSNGRTLAFAWTRGYATGKFNIFVMDVVTHKYLQLTHDEGRNENPVWAPDGVHLAFSSDRGGSEQIYSMLADGSQPQKLTSQGINTHPAWGK
jgi:TolB protein